MLEYSYFFYFDLGVFIYEKINIRLKYQSLVLNQNYRFTKINSGSNYNLVKKILY